MRGKKGRKQKESLKKLLELTGDKDLLSLQPGSESDVMTYHHITKEQEGGRESYINGAPLLNSNHQFLNEIEIYNNDLYCELNCAFDCMKELMEMVYALSDLFPEVSRDENSEEFIYDTSLDQQEVEDIIPVDELTAQQLIELKKAAWIYKNEVIPAFQALKKEYYRIGEYPDENVTPVLYSNYQFLNNVEVYDNDLYYEMNQAFDYMKELSEMVSVLLDLFPEVSRDENLEEFFYDENLDLQEVEDIIPVDDITPEQIIELRKAARIYENELMPAFEALKEKYYLNENGRKL